MPYPPVQKRQQTNLIKFNWIQRRRRRKQSCRELKAVKHVGFRVRLPVSKHWQYDNFLAVRPWAAFVLPFQGFWFHSLQNNRVVMNVKWDNIHVGHFVQSACIPANLHSNGCERRQDMTYSGHSFLKIPFIRPLVCASILLMEVPPNDKRPTNGKSPS